MVKITNSDELKNWLKDKPKEWSVVIASRAALRVIPYLHPLFQKNRSLTSLNHDIALAVFRANTSAWAAVNFLTKSNELPAFFADAADAASYVSDTDIAAAYAADAANAADAAASATFPVDAAAFAAQAADAATFAVDDVASAISIWSEIPADLTHLDSGGSVETLSSRKLRSDNLGDSVDQEWQILRQCLLVAGDGWEVWANWYEDRLAGCQTAALPREFAQELDLRIAKQLDDWWVRGPAEVNADIKAWIVEALLKAAQQMSLGSLWLENKQDQISPDFSEHIDDIAIAAESTSCQLHSGIIRRLNEFDQVAQEIEEILGWGGFVASFERFKKAIDCETSDIPAKLGEVYETTIDFAKFIEQDNWIRSNGGGNISPLDPVRRRQFESIIELTAPWIRRFPTARQLDDDLGAFLGNLPDKMLSSQLAQAAGDAELISKDDRELLQSLLSAFEANGPLYEKAVTRGTHNVQTLTYKAAAVVIAFYSGAIASDFSTKSVLVSRAGEYLVTGEELILKHLESVPADIRQAVLSAIERSKQSQNETGEDVAMIDSRRRKRDDQ